MKRGAKGSGGNGGKHAKPIDANVVKRESLFRRAATSLPLIVLAALLLRVGFAWDYVGQNSRQALAVLPFLQESGNIAASLASGHGFSSPFRIETGPTAWMPPVYPWLLAGIFRVFGVRTYDSFLAAVTLNILCSAFTCVPIFFAGKRVGGITVAALAAWLWAFFPNTILNAFESMWDASVAALLAAIILWATLAIEKSERWRDWVGYGLLWGVTLLTNVTLISLLPLLPGLAGLPTSEGFFQHQRISPRYGDCVCKACSGICSCLSLLRAMDDPELYGVPSHCAVAIDSRTSDVDWKQRKSAGGMEGRVASDFQLG